MPYAPQFRGASCSVRGMLRHASFWRALAQVLAMVLPFLLGVLAGVAAVSSTKI
jgi:hypothetical protein